MSKVTSLVWVFLALVVVGCGSTSNTQSTEPFFNESSGGQIVFSTVDDQGRSLVMMSPEMFTQNFSSSEDLAGFEIGIKRNAYEYRWPMSVQPFYSSITGFVQFYLTDVQDGDRIELVLLNVESYYITYRATLSGSGTSYGQTDYFDAVDSEGGTDVAGLGSQIDYDTSAPSINFVVDGQSYIVFPVFMFYDDLAYIDQVEMVVEFQDETEVTFNDLRQYYNSTFDAIMVPYDFSTKESLGEGDLIIIDTIYTEFGDNCYYEFYYEPDVVVLADRQAC